MPPRISQLSSKWVCELCRKPTQQTKRRRLLSSTTTSTRPEIYDVVTIGGGPVGLALMAALKTSTATTHLKTTLIEAQDLTAAKQWSLSPDQYSNRASSITPKSEEFLHTIDAWKHMDHTRIQPYQEMQVWDAANDASIQFDWSSEARKYNAPRRTVATMVENANLTRALLQRLDELEVEVSSGTKVSSIAMGEDEPDGANLSNWPVVQTSNGRSIAARLLVGADGVNSPVRTFAWIDTHGWDYNRHGVVATLKVQDDMLAAFQRFSPALGGPIALLPLPDNHASLVWSTTPSNAAYLNTLSAESFTAVVNAALRLSQVDIQYMFQTTEHDSELRWRLKHTDAPLITRQPPFVTGVQDGSIASFPLRFRHTTTMTGPRIALAGDAAHTIHPLAGQGLNLGLGDAEALASTIDYAVQHGMDLGDSMALEKYGRERYGRGMSVGGGVDLLNWVYQLDSGEGLLSNVIGRARGLGMDILNSDIVPGLKSLVMRQAER